ncbi:MAG: ABC transporter permease [Bacteroidetes bacterium]|nr:ABC transporter permease [Bacteroidota bacterium]MCB9226241.1 ABC transporter permease [Chitinophagales bacterium]
MNQILLVTQREYLVQVKKKSFIILTLAMPLLMMALFALVIFFSKANQQTDKIAVIDNSGLFSTVFKSTENELFSFYNDADFSALKDSLNTSNNFQGILFIPKADENYQNLVEGILLLSNKNFSVTKLTSLQNKIANHIEELKLAQKGVSKEDFEEIKTNVSIKVEKLSSTGSTNSNESLETIKMVISTMLMYATFMFIMMYSIRVMRSVLEEKSNRVVEIIISSVKPFNLMIGKILGTTLMAITQFVIWIIFIVILLTVFHNLFPAGGMPNNNLMAQNPAIMQENMNAEFSQTVDALFQLNYPLIIISFLIYFFFGYLLYSAFFAAIGASVDNETDTQQFMWVGLIPLMLGVYGSFSIMDNPDGPVGFWLSLIPFTSPVSMMMRIAYDVPVWQLGLSILILITSVFAMVWFAAKIYKAGILMYGKKASFKDWYKWLRM